jgi:hypothetical protein
MILVFRRNQNRNFQRFLKDSHGDYFMSVSEAPKYPGILFEYFYLLLNGH